MDDPLVQPPVTSDVVQQPQAPVSAPVKEQEPVAVADVIKPEDKEPPPLHPELAEIGVERRKEVPELTLEDKKAGLSLAKEATQVPTQPSGLVKLPMSEEEQDAHIRKGDSSQSVFWFAKLLKKIRDSLRLLHTKLTNP